VGDSPEKSGLIPHNLYGGKGASPWKLLLLDEPALD
jgi:hypothetical protein